MTTALFGGPFVSALFNERENMLRQQVAQLTESELAEATNEALAEEVATRLQLEPIAIDADGFKSSISEAQIDPRRRPSQYDVGRHTPRAVPGIRIHYIVPFSGNRLLLNYNPEGGVLDYPHAEVRERELIFTYDGPASEAERLAEDFQRELRSVVSNAAGMESSVGRFNESLKRTALSLIEARRSHLGEV